MLTKDKFLVIATLTNGATASYEFGSKKEAAKEAAFMRRTHPVASARVLKKGKPHSVTVWAERGMTVYTFNSKEEAEREAACYRSFDFVRDAVVEPSERTYGLGRNE